MEEAVDKKDQIVNQKEEMVNQKEEVKETVDNQQQNILQPMQAMWHHVHHQSRRHATELIEMQNDRVSQQLLTSKLQVANRSKVFTVSKQSFHLRKKMPNTEQIKKKKQEILQMLHEIEQQEDQARKRHHQVAKKQPRSQLTKEEMERIKEVWKEKQRRQQLMKQKDEEIRKSITLSMEREQKETQQQIQQQNREKRDRIVRRLLELENRKKARERQLKQTDRQLKQQMHKKYLIDNLQQKFKQRMETEQRLLEEQAVLRRKAIMVDMEQVKQHQKRYKDVVRQQNRERVMKVQEYRRKIMSESLVHYEDNHFAQILKQQQEQLKKKQKQQQEARQQYKQRMKTYSQEVRQKYMPLPKIATQADSKTQTLADIKSVSVDQLNRIGNEYLKIARSLGRKKQSSTQTIEESPERPKIDYLRQMRQSRHKTAQNSAYMRVKKILNKQHVPYDKVAEAITLADRMETLAGNDCNKLAQSMNAKLHILRTIL